MAPGLRGTSARYLARRGGPRCVTCSQDEFARSARGANCKENTMQTMRKVLVATALMMAAAFPAVAQQDEPSAPSESIPQAGTDQKADQPAPGGMTGGMMKQGEMMHHGSIRMMCDKRGMREGRGMMPPSVPMMEGRLAYFKADLEITDA